VKIVRSSGDRAWDKAAVEAVKRSEPMPRDETGETPRSFTITLRPGV
jgi:TonB family protein